MSKKSPDRTQPITDWLENHNARALAETKAPDGVLRWYSVCGRMIIVQFYTDQEWDVYISACPETNVVATLSSLEAYVKQ